MTLDQLPFDQPATIAGIGWGALPDGDAARLREFGFDMGVSVTLLHGGGWWARDPLAVRIGRMTVAIRRRHAAQMVVEAG